MAQKKKNQQDLMDHQYMLNCLEERGFVAHDMVLRFTYLGGPDVGDDDIDECYYTAYKEAEKYGEPESKSYIPDPDDRIEVMTDKAMCILAQSGYDDYRLIGVPLPLIIEYLINVVNGKRVNIAEMLLDRIREDCKGKDFGGSVRNVQESFELVLGIAKRKANRKK